MNKILKKRKKGATLPLVAACLIILIMLVVAFLGFNMQLGSKRQVQQALNAGTLNLTLNGTAMNKSGTSGVYTTLKPGVEQTNFGIIAVNNNIDLLHYNACVGQAILVALNAMEEGTTAANNNAIAVLNAVQAGSGSIGYRLAQQMATQSNLSSYFTLAANNAANSITMDVNSNKTAPISLKSISTGYVNPYLGSGSNGNPDAVANVSINTSMYSPSIQSFISQYVNTSRPDPNNPGFYLLNGYQPMTFNLGGTPITVMAVTMPPNQGVHLGSGIPSLFNTSSPLVSAAGSAASAAALAAGQSQAAATAAAAAAQANVTGAVPPNAFLVYATLNNSSGATTPQMLSSISGVAGSWNQTYQPSISNGYMQVSNAAGIGFPGIPNMLNPTDSVLNNELMTGVFIANNSAFSTDQNLLNQWVQYNNSGQQGTSPSNVGVFNASGSNATASDLAGITALGQNDASGNSVSECTWLSFTGATAESPCQALASAFQTAYGSNSNTGLPAESLIAVEAAKAQVINNYSNFINVYFASGTSWGSTPSDYVIEASTTPDYYNVSGTTATIGSTGLQVFNHNAAYITQSATNQAWSAVGDVTTVVNSTVSISKAGSIWSYLNDVQNGARTALVYPLTADSNGNVISESKFQTALQNALNSASSTSTPIGSIINRIIQLEPNKSVATLASDIYNVLVNTQIPMDSSFYISVNYHGTKESDGTYPIQLSMQAPAGYNASSPQVADGNARVFVNSYSVIGLSVDTYHELGIHDQLFTNYSGNLMGNDSVTWTPSSGYNNLVGNLTFSNYLTGQETFSAPN